MSITLQEIANKANCSKTSVSLILSGRKNYNISEELCNKIRNIAKKNNYKRKTNTSRVVSLIFPKKTRIDNSPYYSGFLRGLSSTLTERGYAPASIYQNELEDYDMLQENAVVNESSGIVLCEPPSNSFLKFIEGKGIPLITLNFKLPGNPSVVSDIFDCTQEAMAFIKNKNIKSIGFIGNDEHPTYIQRYQFFLSAVSYNELVFEKKNLVKTSVKTHECYKIIKEFLNKAKHDLPDIFVCATEGIAAGAMKVIQDTGFSIPNDIGLLAFGYGSYPFPFVPSLSLIQVMNESEGKLAGKIIADGIEFKEDFGNWSAAAPGQFIAGESC